MFKFAAIMNSQSLFSNEIILPKEINSQIHLAQLEKDDFSKNNLKSMLYLYEDQNNLLQTPKKNNTYITNTSANFALTCDRSGKKEEGNEIIQSVITPRKINNNMNKNNVFNPYYSPYFKNIEDQRLPKLNFIRIPE